MNEHILTILQPAQATPSVALPDGAITGNGDVTAILAGSADRVRLYISKADFWKGDGRVYTEYRGGLSPLAMVEILLPHLAYADYKAEQNLDEAYIGLNLTTGKFSANVKVTVCAEENTVIIELDRSYPTLSASISIVPIEGWEAITDRGSVGDITYAIRSFDTPELRFPTYGICAMKQISRTVSSGRERIVWAITVCTNHDTAAYKYQAIERTRAIDETACETLLTGHAGWWKRFWSKCGVELPDKKLELYWYAGIYATACCMRNKKFAPGIWGAYSTSDGMGWSGDYHLNYNYQGPFYALTSSNHPELLECYSSPLNDFLPTAKRYAEEFLGIKGSYYPVGIGPLGLETDYRPDTKEHSHLFLGQKSNGAYGAVIHMMHWYGTRDKEFAKREYYDYLLSVAEFWENYLVFEDDTYQIYNDCLHEVCWFRGPDHMPEGHDNQNPLLSLCLIRMLMKVMIDLSGELGVNTDRIDKWQHIIDHLPTIGVYEANGKSFLSCRQGAVHLDPLIMECVYPMGQIGRFITPDLYETARNSHETLAVWDDHNRFCSFYPAAARLGFPSDLIIGHIHEVIEKRSLPNGMFRYGGGGLENSSAIPSTINEMLLQSYEGIIRLFPVWDKSCDARFHGLRANGAFVVDASLVNGEIKAEILSEQGMPLTLEVPEGGYTLIMSDGHQKNVTNPLYTVETVKGERITILSNSSKA